jgi:hypothetical protein
VSPTALQMYEQPGGRSRRTLSSMLTRCTVDVTPSTSIAIAARTGVPPSVMRLSKRAANCSTMSEEATNRSPPTPSRTKPSSTTTRSRSLSTGIVVVRSDAWMSYSATSPSITEESHTIS